MLLHQFLTDERLGILALCTQKMRRVQDTRSSSDEMEVGLPIFYDELVEVLRADEHRLGAPDGRTFDTVHRASAMRHGKESLRLGYTISQVVHGYGAVCQSITQYAAEHYRQPIEAREFNRLNFCLDVAIAEAVTEFSEGQRDKTSREEVQRLGHLAHEMRNALANAAAAVHLIKRGTVGLTGSTGQLLEDALRRMKDIIDRSLSEVRLRGEPLVDHQRCRVIDVVSGVEVTALLEAPLRSIEIIVEVPGELEIVADRHLIVSALSNLVQNAIKFTREGGHVWMRAFALADRVLIEVEDECGGLPHGKIEELFRPFVQRGFDRSGIGLGLSIARRAATLNNGEITARDIPGRGCVFCIDLPKADAVPQAA